MVERDDNDDYLEYYNLLNVLPCLLRFVAVRARGPPQDWNDKSYQNFIIYTKNKISN